MARPLRIEFPGAIYHITSRGNARQWIVADDTDRAAFMKHLGAVVERYHWLCHAWCLMDNHYHLLIETPEANLAAGMRTLNGGYTQAYNRRHGRVGHLFQGRYKAILVDREAYLLELSRYVVLNPVRAGMVDDPTDYPWSSYRATCGQEAAPEWLHTDWILSQFASRRARAVAAYRDFVEQGRAVGSPWKALRGQFFLGDEEFRQEMERKLAGAAELEEVPRAQRFAHRPNLEDFLAGVQEWPRPARDEYLWQANRRYGYSLSEIGRALGWHYSTISKAVRRHEESQFKT